MTDAARGEPWVRILPAQDVMVTLESVREPVRATILDPWYNRGVGGVVEGYDRWLCELVEATGRVSEHIFLWGFPDIVCKLLDHLPPDMEMVAWLTWYYKNCPSVIRGWRSAQYTCLHLAKKGAKLYPEHFLNEAQRQRLAEGKLRYMPGPPSVIEAPLNIGFVGRDEQTGHPSQKPVSVIIPLVMMSTVEGDTVLDPMCGAGTTGVACRQLGRNAILSDRDPDYLALAKQRLQPERAPNGQAEEKYSLRYS